MNNYKYTNADQRIEIKDAGAGRKLTDSPNLDLKEKLLGKGASSLSDRELIAVLFGGKNAESAIVSALELLERDANIPSVSELSKLSGIGRHRACLLTALLEFGRRRWGFAGTRIREPEDVFTIIRHYADKKQERFICLSLNGGHEMIAARVVTVGLVNRTIVHPREVFADPIIDRSSAVICAHNHPSGQLTPSHEDDEITERLQNAAEILGINFLDHLIFSEKSFFSYRQASLLLDD